MYFQMMIIKREHYTIGSIHKKSVENQNKILNILKDNNPVFKHISLYPAFFSNVYYIYHWATVYWVTNMVYL